MYASDSVISYCNAKLTQKFVKQLLPKNSMIAPVILASDKTCLSVFLVIKKPGQSTLQLGTLIRQCIMHHPDELLSYLATCLLPN